MNISKVLESHLQSLLDIENKLKDIYILHNETNKDEKLILEKFDFLLTHYSGNPIVLKHFLDFLQTLFDLSICASFELSDIESMFEILNRVTESDIDINIEQYFFTNNVMDDEDKAAEQLKSIKHMIAEKHKYLRKWR